MTFFNFTDTKLLVKGQHQSSVVTSGYGKSGFIYTEVLSISPTSKDRENKKKNIDDLKSFIDRKKLEPHDITPEDYPFLGESYRKLRDSFNRKTRGGKKYKRKTMKKAGEPTVPPATPLLREPTVHL